MPKGYARTNCKICERHVQECGALSTRGKCQDCALSRIRLNALGLASHSGPFHQHWRRQHAAAVGAILFDDIPLER